jgi:hypothetical protein
LENEVTGERWTNLDRALVDHLDDEGVSLTLGLAATETPRREA